MMMMVVMMVMTPTVAPTAATTTAAAVSPTSMPVMMAIPPSEVLWSTFVELLQIINHVQLINLVIADDWSSNLLCNTKDCGTKSNAQCELRHG
jgi:hypothetical protein